MFLTFWWKFLLHTYVFQDWLLVPSFSSKCGHVTEKHVPIGCKHEMLGNQTYEVLQPLSKLSRQSLKLFDGRYVFDKQIRPKLQTRYFSVQGFLKWGDSDGGYASNKWNMRKVSYKPLNCTQVHQTISRDRQHRAAFKKAHQYTKQTVVRWFHLIGDDCPKGSTSLKEIKSELSNFDDCGELSLSTLPRHVRKNLPSSKDYSRKRLGKCAGERFTYENLVYTQLFLDYLSFGHFLKTCSNTLQTSNVWLPNISCLHPIRTCFSVTCPRLDENDGNVMFCRISALNSIWE